jgi:protein-disulfide isomerase-like protein with CxxC motif
MSFTETDKIEQRFKQDLSRRKFDGVIYGVPTKAAQRESRQSFIKTGRYRNSFKAWMEE